MQAILERQRTAESELNSLSALLRSLESADTKAKNDIENKMVALGEGIIPELIKYLQTIKGAVRGVIAMVLIRMGECSVAYLANAASDNSDFAWMAQYLISEIEAPVKIAA